MGLIIFGYLAVDVYHSIIQINARHFFLNIRFGLLFLSILILSLQIFSSAALWSLIAKRLQNEAAFFDFLTAYNLSLLAKYLPGGIWNLVGRAVFLQKKGISLAVVSSSIIYEFLFLLASSATIGGFLLYEYNVVPTWTILLIYICMLFFLFWPNTVIVIMNKALVFFDRKPISCSLSRKDVLIIYLSFVLMWGLYGLAFLLLIQSTNLEYAQSFLQLVAILASSWVIGYLSPTPGGIGVREGLMTLLFEKTSLASSAGLISVISRIWFICAEVLTICIFLILMVIKNFRNRRRSDEQGIPTELLRHKQ